jgi:hypothetical protein
MRPRIEYKVPKTVETHDRVHGEALGRFECARRNFGKMFVCPPKAENIHQLIEDQKIYEKKKALAEFMVEYEADQKAERAGAASSAIMKSSSFRKTI